MWWGGGGSAGFFAAGEVPEEVVVEEVEARTFGGSRCGAARPLDGSLNVFELAECALCRY